MARKEDGSVFRLNENMCIQRKTQTSQIGRGYIENLKSGDYNIRKPLQCALDNILGRQDIRLLVWNIAENGSVLRSVFQDRYQILGTV